MCEAWNEAGESTQTVRVTIKGNKNKFFFSIVIKTKISIVK
jgi:hypothetical protein